MGTLNPTHSLTHLCRSSYSVEMLSSWPGTLDSSSTNHIGTLLCQHATFLLLSPRVGSKVVRIDPLCFLAGCRKRRLNQALSVLYLSMFLVCCCLLGPLFRYRLHWYVFCILVVLAKLSVFAKWLARRNPPKKPNRGKGILSTKIVYDVLGLVYCFIV